MNTAFAKVEAYIDAYNNFDTSAMCKDLSEEVTFENYNGTELNLELKGIHDFAEQAEKAKALFSQRKQTITRKTMDDHVVIVHIDYTGTLAQDLFNGMKAGDTLNLKGKSVFTFEKGRIIKIQDYS